MAHCVSHFPDKDGYLRIVEALVNGGVSYIEVQFPFSDPSADGVPIQEACNQAILNGKFSIEEGFDCLREISERYPVPIFLMTYANLAFRYGIKAFIKSCKACKIAGVIIPDLPYDANEDLLRIGNEQGVPMIPVVTISTPLERMHFYEGCDCVYVSLRSGITGKQTIISSQILNRLHEIRDFFPAIIGGFGIQTSEQVQTIAPHVDIVVVGTAILKSFEQAPTENKFAVLQSFVSSLVHA